MYGRSSVWAFQALTPTYPKIFKFDFTFFYRIYNPFGLFFFSTEGNVKIKVKLHFQNLLARYLGELSEKQYKKLSLCLTKESIFQGVTVFTFPLKN